MPPLSPNHRFQPLVQVQLGATPGGEPQLLTGQVRHLWYLGPDSGLRHYSASSDSAAQRLPLFLEALSMVAGSGQATPRRGQLHFQTGKPVEFVLPEPETARSMLQSLLPLHALAKTRPLPFWAGSAHFILVDKAMESLSPEAVPVEDLLEEYRGKWESDGTLGISGESQKPSTRFAFRGCPNPFALMGSEAAAGFLPDPGRPLSWRIVRFLHAWCTSCNLPLSKPHV